MFPKDTDKGFLPIRKHEENNRLVESERQLCWNSTNKSLELLLTTQIESTKKAKNKVQDQIVSLVNSTKHLIKN